LEFAGFSRSLFLLRFVSLYFLCSFPKIMLLGWDRCKIVADKSSGCIMRVSFL
jgi:hypothetical protein